MISPTDRIEALIDAWFDESDLAYLEYIDIVNIAECVMGDISRVLDADRSSCHDYSVACIDKIARIAERKQFVHFRACAQPTSPLQRFLVELFLAARIRLYVLAYLSVQEGEDFEGVATQDTPIPRLIAETLRDIGKQSLFKVSGHLSNFKFVINLDPTLHLRAVYFSCLSRGRNSFVRRILGTAWRFCHSMQFKVKCWLIVRGAKFLAGDLRGNNNDGLTSIVRAITTPRVMRQPIISIFPDAAFMSNSQWDDLSCRLRQYFPERIGRLIRATPQHSIDNNGMVKLLKVAVGVVAGRVSVRHEHEKDAVDFIFNTIRSAYCWGVTYPLVDNVLDSKATNNEARENLARCISLILDDGVEPLGFDPVCSIDDITIQEAVDRIREAISLVPPPRKFRVRRMVKHLYSAHRSDAQRRLNLLDLKSVCSASAWKHVMVDTLLKSALVRLATMELCAISVDRATRNRALSRALFNQLGDDLWDIIEDMNDDRVTPFTMLALMTDIPDPFVFYLEYAAVLSEGFTRRRVAATYFGVCETLKDTLATLDVNTQEPLDLHTRIHQLVLPTAMGRDLKLVRALPHVDFDAIVFLMEDSIHAMVKI